MKKLIWILLFSASLSANAADSVPPGVGNPTAPTWLLLAREQIKLNQFEKSAEILLAADQKKSADWNNLMGFSMRKKAVPNLEAAEKYYLAALDIEPKHRGALEYYGELLLMKDDLPGAQTVLNRLDKACFFGCEELDDLKKSVRQYKPKK